MGKLSIIVGLVAAALAAFYLLAAGGNDAPFPYPPNDRLAPSGAAGEMAVLAGGCFWGVEGVYDHTQGVTQAVSGFAGGEKATAHYEVVSEGNTGHAESVQILFDPSKISYGTVLKIFFSVAHDPTEKNRQGPDTGTQYRSVIFYASDAQKQMAESYIRELDAAHVYKHPIVTEVVPLKGFYAAEAEHQKFLDHNPTYPYIVFNDLPKLRHLKQLYPDLYKK